MLNRSQTIILFLDLLESFIANPVGETYGKFTRYFQEHYAETNKIVEQCLAAKRNVDLSLEVRGLLEALLILFDRSGTNTGKKAVAPLSKLVLQFPESSLLMNALALCFRKGAAFSDLQDTMDRNRLFPAGVKSWNSNCLSFYCQDKYWRMSKGINWFLMAWYFRNGISEEGLFWSSYSKSYFPAKAMSWKAVQFAAYCSAKELVRNPKQFQCWHDLAIDFSRGEMVADLPVEFLPMIFSCIKNDAPANYYCTVFCLEQTLKFAPQLKGQMILDQYKIAKNELERRQYNSGNHPQQASNTLTKLSHLTVSQFIKPDNKRKLDEVPVGNKIAKINNNESPSMQVQSSQYSFGFFPLPNQVVTEGPVLHFDAKEIMKVIKVLRGNNTCMINCVHLAKDLLEYFKTGKMPVSPSSTASSTPEEFSVLITTDWIERERGTPYLGVINSVVDETNFTDFPCDMEIPQTPGGTEGEPILNVDRFTQPSASYDEIDNRLKTLAREHKQGVSFGLINVGRCGNYVENPGHTLFYFATSDCVWYVDAQLFNGEKQLDYGCIFPDLSVYPFAGKNRLGPNTFGGIVFYIPCGPHIPELTLIQVKKEPVDECGQYFNI